jgi:hypothetical protein
VRLVTVDDSPCIEVDLGSDDRPAMTAAAYDEVHRQRTDQPLWARSSPPVQALSLKPSKPGWSVRITDQAAYDAQMHRLLGFTD